MITDALFGDANVDAIFSDEHRIATMLRVEVSLARAQAAAGVIPARSADVIERSANVADYDLSALARDAAQAGNLAIPLVKQLTERVTRIDTDAARHVHWGATSQDIIDTALVLQLRDATAVILQSLERAGDAAAKLARAHATTVLAGRTWLQHATPTTFGLKAAGWMSALDRAHAEVSSALASALVLQLGGASGTLAAFGDRSLDIATSMAAELDLAPPTLPWHAHRDRLATLACALGIAVGTMGKIARDIALLAQTEVAEAFEASAEGRGGSSTMPQKRNPVSAAVILAAATRAPGFVATMLAAMPQEHERALGGWQAEWETLPMLVRIAAGAARHSAEMLGGLEVDAARMRANADMTLGVSMSEAVSMELAMHIGKFDAHRTIGEASRRAIDERRPLADVLATMPEVTKHLKPADIARALDPSHYLGAAEQLVRSALTEHDRAHARAHARDGDSRSAPTARHT